MHKVPYCWHQPDLKKMTFENFLTHCIEDYENVIKMWNEKNRSYLRIYQEVPHGIILRIEDMIEDQEDIYKRIQKFLPPKGSFLPYNKYRVGGGEKDRPLSDIVSNNFEFSETALNCIYHDIDHHLAKQLGYELKLPLSDTFRSYVQNRIR